MSDMFATSDQMQTEPTVPEPASSGGAAEQIVEEAALAGAPPLSEVDPAMDASANPEAGTALDPAVGAEQEAPQPYDPYGDPELAPDPDFQPQRTWADATGGLADYAEQRMADYGWGPQEMPALIALWNQVSSPYTQSHTGTAYWDPEARNMMNGASGIPGLLPDTVQTLGNPMMWDNPQHQMDVGMTYIQGKYKTPTLALRHMRQFNWY